ncbi:hypothetical protein Fmac_030924 [Flemingia macrophylla]|uniref:Uncharacterized protein n=1 Tax=Flemingia macrophylla TaxID=520843 RepID=A0ABD1L127_9FABA
MPQTDKNCTGASSGGIQVAQGGPLNPMHDMACDALMQHESYATPMNILSLPAHSYFFL